MPKDKCACRTINLAKEGHTIEERKCKMLIFEKNSDQPAACIPPVELGLKEPHPSAKRVRVCTAADIKSTCQPPMCSCPIAVPPLTLTQILWKTAGAGVKTLIFATVVYATVEAGVWADAKRTECLYVQLKNVITGSVCTCEEDGAPRVDRIMHAGRQKWNSLISGAFTCTNNLIRKITRVDRECPKPKK